MLYSKKNLHTKGFTLIETLVAIGILALSVTATFAAVQNSISQSSVVKDRITAFYLVQEAMEFIRNIRDENALYTLGGTPRHWLYGLAELPSDPCYFGKTCTIDSPLKLVSQCTSSFASCPFLRQNTPASGTAQLWGYNAIWPVTRFRRSIQFTTQSNNPDEIKVTIYVAWTAKGGSKTFQVTEALLNHQ